jgi:hypothetical protein
LHILEIRMTANCTFSTQQRGQNSSAEHEKVAIWKKIV